ncbi:MULTISPECIES: hypothetical protein [Bradyrhizobium]|uniref:hypothetical protein n=1 Tax=Bradyrhizobium TaxID=374 RepID=UPI00155E329D|nr:MULTISPECIES: hypothetical protein [Bradyrhizobium]MDD1519581.1 hypothetical protein [Bradyrhizobium sp. WBAH30]MDD1543825.1 hypothetical protein [Bradyrhizobium sp. WBAH41]MDD1557890.1 hypothetical protein [Bradyrhizobium sp. WBAH23]MDD1565303.1 hypothetical protein [Bradyrhizobium sp. WBAH33]MDD1592206.1 hypothetical protein [Bradyrhizobium sp. WBAH42]
MVQELRSSRNALRLGTGIALALSVALASVSPAAAQSLTDRFKSLFGGKSDEPAEPKPAPAPGQPAEDDLDCPQVTVRAGASTYAVGASGKPAVGNDIRFQASITKMARECSRSSAGITARIGIQGRVIAGPAGAPASVEVPLRIAVVQGGVGEKVIASKAYRTTVAMSEGGSVPFTFVAEDLAYPTPAPAVADNYIFYVGFDPQALSPEPKARKKK